MHSCEFHNLGSIGFAQAFAMQQDLAARRKQDLICDQLLILEHPHVITLGRNAHDENILASREILERAGIELHPTDRGGDVTYHGPGQIVCYPIMDLKAWKRDVVAYVRTLEQVIIDALADFGIAAERNPGCTGVWVNGAKIAAIGVHLSRWVTSHGFALNVDTNLNYFQYIIPCGLTKPVTSLRALGSVARREEVVTSLVRHFANNFECEFVETPRAPERIA